MAAKGLSTLIRLGQWAVDEKRRKLGQLLTLADQLRDQKMRLEAEIAHEREVAAQDPEAGQGFSAYATAARERREKLEASIAEVERNIQEAQEDLAEAYRELKSYEVTQTNRLRRAREEFERAEQARLDEIALTLYRRRQA